MASDDLRLEVVGLSAALRAINRFDRQLGSSARDVIKAGARLIQVKSQSRNRSRPGGGTYPRRRGMIGRSASQKGAGVSLKVVRYPWAFGAEFGSKRAWVFGRVTSQDQLRRRQFPVWRGNQFVVRGRRGPGWIIQPVIRENIDRVTKDIADGLDKVLREALDRERVPRPGRAVA